MDDRIKCWLSLSEPVRSVQSTCLGQQYSTASIQTGDMHLIEDTSQLDITKVKKSYDGLISERGQSTDAHLNTLEVMGSNNEVTRDIHISYPTQQILRKFKKFAEKMGFVVVESFCDQLYLCRGGIFRKLKKALCCLMSTYRPATSRFHVTTDEYRSVRVLTWESLEFGEGDLINDLRQLLQAFSQKQLPNPPYIDDDENQQDLKTLEATSHYMYCKMLLEENYSMGQKVSNFLTSAPVGNATLQSILWLEEVKSQIVEDMLEGFNCSRKELTQILCYCRIVVQQFLYSRIFPKKLKYELEQEKIQACRFQYTLKQLIRLDDVASPSLLDRQIFFVMSTLTYEIEAKRKSGETVNKAQALCQLLREYRLPNLPIRMHIQQIYHEINQEPDHYHEFEKIYRASQDTR